MTQRAAKTTSRRRGRLRSESGESLAEVLVALTILSVAIVVIVQTMSVSLALTHRQREQAVAHTVMLAEADLVKNPQLAYNSSCPSTNYPVQVTGIVFPGGWSSSNITLTTTQWWDGTTFQTSCIAGAPLEVVTVKVTSPRYGYVATTDVVKRNTT